MAKSRKRKAGLQKKVSAVFEGVSIPQSDDIVQTPTKPTSDRLNDVSSEQTFKDSLVSKSSLMKKVCRSESSSVKATKKAAKPVVSKRTASASSTSQASAPSKTRRAKAKPAKAEKKTAKKVVSKKTASASSTTQASAPSKTRRAKAKPAKAAKKTTKTVLLKRTVSKPEVIKASTIQKPCKAKNEPDKKAPSLSMDDGSKPPDLDHLIPQRSQAKKSKIIQSILDQTTKDCSSGVPPKLTAPDDSIPKHTREKEPSQTKNLSDRFEPDDAVGILPEQTVPDHPVSQQPPLKEPSKNEDKLDETEPERTIEIPSEPIAPDDSTLLYSPTEDLPQTESMSDEAEPDRSEKASSEPTISKLPIQPEPPEQASPQVEDEADTATSNFTMSVPTWMTSPDDTDLLDSLINESAPSEGSSSPDEADLADNVSQTAGDRSRARLPSLKKEPRATETFSDRISPSRKSWVPPKLTTQDFPISKGSSERKTEQAKRTSNEPETDRMEDDAQKPSIVESAASQDSLAKRLYKTGKTSEISAPDRPAKASPLSPRSESEKRFGPQVSPGEDVSSTPFDMEDLPVASSRSLWQLINNKLFAPQPGVSPTRQKVMVISIPILAIVLIFVFRQVLSKSPRKTKGTTTEEKALVIETDPDHQIDWQIPDPLPATMRDPTVLPAVQSDTPPEEQEQPVQRPKTKRVNLSTIVYSHDRPSAIVNGRIVYVGEQVSGVTILNINRDSVEFEKDGEQWVQTIRD